MIPYSHQFSTPQYTGIALYIYILYNGSLVNMLKLHHPTFCNFGDIANFCKHRKFNLISYVLQGFLFKTYSIFWRKSKSIRPLSLIIPVMKVRRQCAMLFFVKTMFLCKLKINKISNFSLNLQNCILQRSKIGSLSNLHLAIQTHASWGVWMIVKWKAYTFQ